MKIFVFNYSLYDKVEYPKEFTGNVMVELISGQSHISSVAVRRNKDFCLYAAAFMCHHNSFLIYESLVDANAKRWNFVTHISVLFSMACSLVLGVTGYSTFTGYTQGLSLSASLSSVLD